MLETPWFVFPQILVSAKDLIFTFIFKLLGISDYKSNMFIVKNVEKTQRCKDKNKITHNYTT